MAPRAPRYMGFQTESCPHSENPVYQAQGDKFRELAMVQETSQSFARFHNSDNETAVLTICDTHL